MCQFLVLVLDLICSFSSVQDFFLLKRPEKDPEEKRCPGNKKLV